MRTRNSYIFGWAVHQKRRRLRNLALAPIAFIILSLVILPLAAAFADSALEIPSNPDSDSSAASPEDYSTPEADPLPPAHSRADAIPAGVGSANDYLHQDGEEQTGSSSMGPGYSGGYASNPYNYGGNPYSYSQNADPNQNQDALTAAAIVGGIALGLMALDALSAAHQRHHHR